MEVSGPLLEPQNSGLSEYNPGDPSSAQTFASLGAIDAVAPPVSPPPLGAAQPVTDVLQPITTSTTADATHAGALPRRHSFHPRVRPIRIHVKVHTFDSFQYRNYRFLWAATVFSSAGFWLQQIIIGWLTYNVTQSALLTSLAMGLDALPILLAGPVGGLIVDNWDRRKLLALMYGYQALVTLIFATLVLLEYVQPWNIFGFIFLMGISWVITDPARMSLIPNIVPREGLINAFALNSLAFSSTRLAAPALGGLLLVLVGVGPALLIEASLQLIAVVMAIELRVQAVSRPRLRLASTPSELMEGIRYVRGDRVVLGLFVFGVIPSVMVVPFVHGLMPVYAAEIFAVGPTGLGLLLSAVGAGAVVGTSALASWGNFQYRGRLIFISVALMGVMMAIFSRNAWFGPAFLNIMALSAGMMMFFTITNATIQSVLRDDYRGRVTGIFMITWGMTPIGSLLAGSLAQSLGAPMATLIASAAVGTALLWMALRFRSIWSLR